MAPHEAVADALRDISKNSLIAPAPFKPFNAALIKQVTRQADYDRWSREFLGG